MKVQSMADIEIDLSLSLGVPLALFYTTEILGWALKYVINIGKYETIKVAYFASGHITIGGLGWFLLSGNIVKSVAAYCANLIVTTIMTIKTRTIEIEVILFRICIFLIKVNGNIIP